MNSNFEEEFHAMLDERKLFGAGRFDVMSKSNAEKEQILTLHRRDRDSRDRDSNLSNVSQRQTSVSKRQSFWDRMLNVNQPEILNSSEINQKFLYLINRLEYTERDKSKMLNYSLKQKQHFMTNYNNFAKRQSEPVDFHHPSLVSHPSHGSQGSHPASNRASNPVSYPISHRASQPSFNVPPRHHSSANIYQGNHNNRVSIHSFPVRNESIINPDLKPGIPPAPLSKRSTTEIAEINVASEFIYKISNREETMKNLLHNLRDLNVSFSLGGSRLVNAFVSTKVANYTGINALEIALDRVCPVYLQKRIKSASSQLIVDKPLPETPIPTTHPKWYKDHVFPYEIRLIAMQCIEQVMKTDLGMHTIIGTSSLIKQIFWSFSVPSKSDQSEMHKDPNLRRTYLQLLSTIARVFAPVCFIDPRLREEIIAVFTMLGKYQKEPYHFYYIVHYLMNPFLFNSKKTAYMVHLLDHHLWVDEAEIWELRVQLMVLFNGLVSSGETRSKRVKVRTMLESCALRQIIKKVAAEGPPDAFLEQVSLYDQDREEDLGASVRSSRSEDDPVKDVFEVVGLACDPELVASFVKRTVYNIGEIVRHLGTGRSEEETKMRESVEVLCSLVERTTRSLAESMDDLKAGEEVMAVVQRQFLGATYELIGEGGEKRDVSSRLGAMFGELEDTKEKFAGAMKVVEVQRKEIEFLKMTSGKAVASKASVIDVMGGEDGGSVATAGEQEYPELVKKSEELWLENEKLKSILEAGRVPIFTTQEEVVGVQDPPVADVVTVQQDVVIGGESETVVEGEEMIEAEPISGPPPAPPMNPVDVVHARDPAFNNIRKAKKPMKVLPWEKQTDVESTIWKTIFTQAYQHDILDEDEMTALFEKVDPKAAVKQEYPQESTDKLVRFLDTKISRNLEIMLFSLKSFTHESIRDAILKVDDPILDQDFIGRILKTIPKYEVMQKITQFGNQSQLAVSDRFIGVLSDIPFVSERLTCMAFRMHYNNEIHVIRPDIASITTACQELRNSSGFHMILQTVLVIGNFMNGGTFREDAMGFRIASLLELKSTKSNGSSSSPTLLHHLARILTRTVPNSLDFLNEMPSVQIASEISFQSVIDVAAVMALEFKKVKSRVEKSRNSCLDGDRFMEVFDPFCVKVSPEMVRLDHGIIALKETMRETLAFFGEEQIESPQKLFETICEFSRDLKRAKTELDLFDHMEARKAARELVKESQLLTETFDNLESELASVCGSPRSPQDLEDGDGAWATADSTMKGGISLSKKRVTMKRIKTKTFE